LDRLGGRRAATGRHVDATLPVRAPKCKRCFHRACEPDGGPDGCGVALLSADWFRCRRTLSGASSGAAGPATSVTAVSRQSNVLDQRLHQESGSKGRE